VKFVEQIVVPVSLAQAWGFLWQADRLAACLPGCLGVQTIEAEKVYLANFEDRIGPYKVKFDLNVAVEESEPERMIRLRATGKDAKLGISQDVRLTVNLHEESPASTMLDVDADVEVLGKVATLGQFAVKRKAGEVVKQLAANIQTELRSVADASHA
jgi:uncharacterized protein